MRGMKRRLAVALVSLVWLAASTAPAVEGNRRPADGSAGAAASARLDVDHVAPEVAAAGSVPTLTPSTFSAPPNAAVRVEVEGGPGNPTDWVGLFQVGAKNQHPSAWCYLDGTQTPPVSGLTAASLSFTLPHRPTNYEFRFFSAGGTTPIVSTPRVLVQSPTMPPPPASPLPFDPLPYETYNGQVRKVVVHHHSYTMKGGPSVQNRDGFDPAEWWNDALTDGFALVGGSPCDGGAVRSRPYPLPVLPGRFAEQRWGTEFQDYKNAGVDLVFVNGQPASGSGGTSGDRMVEALDLAAALGGIKVAMNIDFAGVVPPNQPVISPAAAAAWARDHVFNKPAYLRHPVNGRYYVGAFLPHSHLVQWYKDFVQACEVQGTPVAFMPSANYNRATMLADYQDLGPEKLSGYGAWAGRSLNADFTSEADTAWSNGRRTYIWPVAPADFRIYKNSYLWDESNGPRQFINHWSRAIAYKTAADPLWVQHSTGTDQLEGTATWPTTGANYLWTDLATWYMHALKMGSFPPITRDCLMYCHRTQHHALRGHSDRRAWTYPWNNVQPESRIYAIAFPTEASTVEISLGDRTAGFAVPAGQMSVLSMDFAEGESGVPVFRMFRGGAAIIEIASSFPIVTSIPFTDPEYKGGSSLRRGTHAPVKPAQIHVPEGDRSAKLVNLSARGVAAAGESALFGGFVMAGPTGLRKSLLIRSVAATLRDFSVEGVLRKPRLALFDADGRPIVVARTQDTYDSAGEVRSELAAAAALAGAFPLLRQEGRGGPSTDPSGDVAVLARLEPGLYTISVTPDTDTMPDPPAASEPASHPESGIVLLELYDLSPGDGAVLLNMSARARVESGDRCLIIGMVGTGGGHARLLLRSVGPSLSPFGVTQALRDPHLSIHDRFGQRVASNDDWSVSTAADQSVGIGAAVGAFPLPPASTDSALLLRLPVAPFTMIVSPAEGTTSGTALGEAYLVL